MRKEAFIEANRREYGERYETLRWITEKEAAEAREIRSRLIGTPVRNRKSPTTKRQQDL